MEQIRAVFDIGGAFETLINWLTHNADWLFDIIGMVVESVLNGFNMVLIFLHPALMCLLLVALAWYLAGRGVAIFSAIGFPIIWYMGLWVHTMDTLSLVIASVFISLVIGIPLGIWTSKSETAWQFVRPVLDFMQTLPAFVYLIPAVLFFRLGP